LVTSELKRDRALSNNGKALDCIYVAASAHDGRYTRICVSSIRYFYPSTIIKLLPGGPLQVGLSQELSRYWDVRLADVRPGNWGWGFVKLEPLFGRQGERFMVVDSDTVFVGPVVDKWAESDADFLVDHELQNEADTHRLYYDWQEVAKIDPTACAPQFVFNSGQWFGTAGKLTRDDFQSLIDWRGAQPRPRHPGLFKQGEQGLLNYILNQKALRGALAIDRQKIMCWPGHGMNGLDAKIIADRRAPALVVHWAGMKKSKLSEMVGGDLLLFFEKLYYQRLPRPRLQRMLGIGRHVWIDLRTRLEIRGKTWRRRWSSNRSGLNPASS
jgi:hypothetical protein